MNRASLEFIIASGAGMKRKGGGKLTIADFTPDFVKPKKTPEQKEAELKSFFIELSKAKPK